MMATTLIFSMLTVDCDNFYPVQFASIANLQALDKHCCMHLVLSNPQLLHLLGPLDGANLPIGTRLQHDDAIPRQSGKYYKQIATPNATTTK
jgi:hypothetical protein